MQRSDSRAVNQMDECAQIRSGIENLLDRADTELDVQDGERVRDGIKRAREHGAPSLPPLPRKSQAATRIGEQLLGYLADADETCPDQAGAFEALIQERLPNP